MAESTQIIRLNQVGNQMAQSKLKKIYLKKKESAVLRKIKSEYIIRDRLSTKIFDDIEATKTAYDIIYPSAGEDLIKGIIQTISQNPFGFIFLSKINVIIFFKYKYNCSTMLCANFTVKLAKHLKLRNLI